MRQKLLVRFRRPRYIILFVVAIAFAWLLLRETLYRDYYNWRRAVIISNILVTPAFQKQLSDMRKKTVYFADLLNKPTKIEAFKMADDFAISSGKANSKNTVAGFTFESKKSVTGNSFALRLSDLVLKPQTYSYLHKACGFRPTVAYRFWKGEKSVTILLCFGCNQLVASQDGAPVQDFVSLRGHTQCPTRFTEEFDLYRPELLELTKNMFPNDKTIQALSTYNTGLYKL